MEENSGVMHAPDREWMTFKKVPTRNVADDIKTKQQLKVMFESDVSTWA